MPHPGHVPCRCSAFLIDCLATRCCRDAIHRLFLKYKDEGDGDDEHASVGVEGISQLCADLGVEVDDIVVLVLRWAGLDG